MQKTKAKKTIGYQKMQRATFAVILVIFSALGIFAISNARTIAARTRTLYNRPHTNLEAVAEHAQEITASVEQISTASMEQANAVSQINAGVDQISNVVQNNSATAEETASASEELSAQAQTLKGLVEHFILKK